MGLTSTLGIAMSGLRATQDGLAITSGNIANSQTPGYIRRVSNPTEQVANGRGQGVQSGQAQRLLDAILQRELRTETSGAGYASTRAQATRQLEQLFGAPGAPSSLDSTMSAFTSALQGLVADPSSNTQRGLVLSGADRLASQIRSISNGVQSLRTNAETRISQDVTRANELIASLAELNEKMRSRVVTDPALLDQRDRSIDELAGLIDLRVSDTGNGTVSLTTLSGARLLDSSGPVTLAFNAKGDLRPDNLDNPDPALRSVGSLTATDVTGAVTDLRGAIRSGSIAANLELRDVTLANAQAQLDEIAGKLSSALSDRTVNGQSVTSGTQTGFSVDVSSLAKGNRITLDYLDNGQARRVTFVRVDDASQLPLRDSLTPDTTDRVFGIDFSGGTGTAATQIAAALGAGFSVAAPSATSLSIMTGTASTLSVTGLSATQTVTGLRSGNPEIPLFIDLKTGMPFTGSLDGEPQIRGLAQRLAVNPAVMADRSSLVIYDTNTLAGDPVRPQLMLDRLTKSRSSFDPSTGIGSAGAPLQGTVRDFVNRVIEEQSQVAGTALRLEEGQQLVLGAIQSRFSELSSVNIDQEMANLIQLQSAYAANARVTSAVKEMMDLLLRM